MISLKNLRESGVSPVVGVMLILVIMIVLVGVFAIAATSIFSAGDAPIDAEINYLGNTSNGTYIFEMMSGEPFSTAKLKVVFTSRESPMDFAERFNITSTHNSTVMLGDRLLVDKPTEFSTSGKHIIWMFYDTSAGALVSSGEIPPS